MKTKTKIKMKLADWIYNNSSFPKKDLQEENFLWLFKDNCPYCIDRPFEYLSNMSYHKKYPACNKLYVGGHVKISICDRHLSQLYVTIRKMVEEKIDKGDIIVSEEEGVRYKGEEENE